MDHKKTVVICDDDEGLLEVMTMILSQKGYHVVALSESKKVLETLKSLDPVVTLLDLWIPDGNGDELIKNLKKENATKHVPLVLVSADKDTEQIANTAGADDFLCKPFDMEALEQMVEKFL